jgi:NTE family protein
VTEREKDFRFSSRTRLNTTNELDRHVDALTERRQSAKLPPAMRHDPNAIAPSSLRRDGGVDVVHLIFRSKHYESQSKDYEFSRLSMQEHWNAGRADMAHTLTGRLHARGGSSRLDHPLVDLTAAAADTYSKLLPLICTETTMRLHFWEGLE